ncbi:MAG TPA: alpha/beta fold hydrolase [Anaeromyxobacter sp.]|nr:alpha/beta fold hydrolase [Anaeromyxobacter sp.]
MPIAHVTGTELHFRDAGASRATRDAVVLLHAFPLHSGMWARQLATLEAKHRVVALDYRGMGRSGVPPEVLGMDVVAEDVRALLAHLRVERAAVVGLSMGGYVAFELYRRAPGLFRGLALCDTKAAPDGDEARKNRETFARTALERGLGWVADEMIPKLLRPMPDPAVVKEVRHLVAGATPAGVAACQRGMARRPDSTPTLATIACPTLVVVGEHDAGTPPAEAEKMAAAVKGSRLVRIPDAGHLSSLENPAAFDAALVEFVNGLPA